MCRRSQTILYSQERIGLLLTEAGLTDHPYLIQVLSLTEIDIQPQISLHRTPDTSASERKKT